LTEPIYIPFLNTSSDNLSKMQLLEAFILAGGFATLANAHMVLRVPTPYSYAGFSNSPVTKDNFPCQVGALSADGITGEPTPMTKGETQEMAFTGGTTHSGGSCQVSLTYDVPPTKDSVFKVIHSIQGGCTGKNTTGNMSPSADFQGPDRYPYKIPMDVPSGKASLAWSWINRSGGVNEFYMNCAPIDIQGDGGDESALAALPDMFVANIEGLSDCKSVLMFDTIYPDPGNSLDDSFPDADLKEPICGGGAGGAGGAAGGAATADPAAPAATTPAIRGRSNIFRA
jgi:hypothetical protein